MRSSTEVGKELVLGADYLLYLLAEKNLYENRSNMEKLVGGFNSIAKVARY